MAPLTFGGYKLTFACRAEAALRWETHAIAEYKKTIWDPAQGFLDNLAKQRPKKLECITDLERQRGGQNSREMDAWVVGPEKIVVPLGTIINHARAVEIYRWFFKVFPKISAGKERIPPDSAAQEIKRRGPMTIIRSWNFCSIPVDCQEIDFRQAKIGIRRYLEVFAPELTKIPITFMARDTQMKIVQIINDMGRRTATPQSREEKMRILGEDL